MYGIPIDAGMLIMMMVSKMNFSSLLTGSMFTGFF
jgi:hypothetical protein